MAVEVPSHIPSTHVFLVCSSGGHLAQLLELRSWWERYDHTWVTFDTPDASSQLKGEDVVHASFPTTRNAKNLLRNAALAVRVLRPHRNAIVVSSGAGVAVPFFAVARAFGLSTAYIEVVDRVDTRTVTGRLCQPLSSEFLVQWPEQQRLYRGSTLVGVLF